MKPSQGQGEHLPLQDLLLRAQNIAIIVDDWTRPTPVAEILEIMLSLLANHGFSREHITIVVALGTHEAMKREELEARVGRNVASSYKVLQHNAWQSDLVPVKLPGDGRVVKISPEVARADLRVLWPCGGWIPHLLPINRKAGPGNSPAFSSRKDAFDGFHQMSYFTL